jgi:hypothetical protein
VGVVVAGVGVLVVRFYEVIKACLDNIAGGYGLGIVQVVVCGGFFVDVEAFNCVEEGAFLLGV